MLVIFKKILGQKKAAEPASVFSQVVLVWIFCIVLSVVICIFAGNAMRQHLKEETKKAIDFLEIEIMAGLINSETLINSVFFTLRNMILQGASPSMVNEYIKDIYKHTNENKKSGLGTDIKNIYGYFDIFDGLYFNGGNMEMPADYKPHEQPWYKTAVDAEGELTVLPPHVDRWTEEIVVIYTRQILDNNDRPLGILCMDVSLERISADISQTSFIEGGYNLLLNEKLEVIAHHFTYYLGKPLREWDSGLAGFADELERGDAVSEQKARNYMGDKSIVFIRRLQNNWYAGIVTPFHKYYKEVSSIRFKIVLFCLALAAALSIMFFRISAEKTKSDAQNQQKSHFLATMSHEIRTPMNAILGIAEIQLQEDTLSQDTRGAFNKINSSGNLLLGIINDILDLSKIEAGKLDLQLEQYDVQNLIKDTVLLNMLRFEGKPVAFKLKADENLPITLIGDELRIKQILNNLLTNAFKYTDSGEISLSASAEYLMRGGAAHITLVFRISDTGHGMTAEQVRKLSYEQFRFNMEANRTTEGTGLGMSITQNLVRLMFGDISIESKQGKGTTVTVRLPQKNVGASMIGKEAAESMQHFRINNASQLKKAQIIHEPMPYGRVLIVDDVESNLYVAKGLMIPYGLFIDTATSGFEAIEKIKNGNVYDIVFMDHMMPKMDGIEATKMIRGLNYKHPIIALTANALLGQAEVFLANGFDGFIAKPIDIRKLNSSLVKLIRDKQPPEVIEAAWKQSKEQAMKEVPVMVIDRQLAEIFARDAGKAIDTLEKTYNKQNAGGDDVQTYIISVHAMKSALANIGETELSALAYKLEKAGREQNYSVISNDTPVFLSSLRAVVEKIMPKENEGNKEITKEDRIHLCENLTAVQNACETYDKKTAKKILSGLQQKTWPRPEKELLGNIAGYLLHSEFEEASRAAGEYVKCQ